MELLYVGEEDVGESCAMGDLDLPRGEGIGPQQVLQETDAGLGGELVRHRGHLKAGAVVNGGVEVLLERLWAVSEAQEREVLDIYLDSLARDGHSITLGFPARPGAAPLHQPCPLGHPVHTKHAELGVFWNTPEWKALYNQRQAVERAFSRLKGQRTLSSIRVRHRLKVTTHCYLSLIAMQVVSTYAVPDRLEPARV